MADKKQLEFSKDFISATKAILKQYDEKIAPFVNLSERYDVILLVNCFYGLLMMPSKLNNGLLKKYGNAKDILRKNNLWGDDKITFENFSSDNISFEVFVRSIRNGLGHWNDRLNKEYGFQGVRTSFSNLNQIEKIQINGTYSIYYEKDGKKKQKVNHVNTTINLINKEIILKFLELIYNPQFPIKSSDTTKSNKSFKAEMEPKK